MFDYFKFKEIFVSSDMKKVTAVMQELDKNNILYKTKTINNSTYNRLTGYVIGRLGENITGNLYYVYVAKKDYLIAENIINKSTMR